jgi:hypothetical protein
MLQLFGKVFVVAVALNFPWEMAQAYLYAPMGDWGTATRRCFGAALADGGIVVVMVVAGIIVFRRYDWIRDLGPAQIAFSAVIGGIIAVLVEHYSLRAGRWAYSSLMPMIPGTDVGTVPVLQMVILPLVTFRLVAGNSRTGAR